MNLKKLISVNVPKLSKIRDYMNERTMKYMWQMCQESALRQQRLLRGIEASTK